MAGIKQQAVSSLQTPSAFEERSLLAFDAHRYTLLTGDTGGNT